jgi:hypothetical protein
MPKEVAARAHHAAGKISATTMQFKEAGYNGDIIRLY